MLIIGDHLHKTMKHLSLEYCHHLCHCTVEKVEQDQVGQERARLQVRAQPQGRLFKAVKRKGGPVCPCDGHKHSEQGFSLIKCTKQA